MKKILKCVFVVIFVLVPFLAWSANGHITILHFNDIHGHLEVEKNIGGAARIAKIIGDTRKQVEENGGIVLVLFGGDALTGTTLSFETKGKVMFDFLNRLNIDAAAIGNHDFDEGRNQTDILVNMAKFPILAANIYDEETGKLFLKPYTIIDKNGIKIGIIGLAHPETPSLTLPDDISGLEFTNVAEATKKYLKEVKSADFVIALTHNGFEYDAELVKQVRGLNVVIGGHDHDENGCKLVVKKTPICRAKSDGKFVGKVDFDIIGKKIIYRGNRQIELNEALGSDEETASWLDTSVSSINKKYDTVIGVARENLPNRGGCQTKLGHLIADSMLKRTGAEVAFTNTGGIRASIEKGTVSMKDVVAVLPFRNKVTTMNVSGEVLGEMTARLVKDGGKNCNLQFSGVEFGLDDERIVNVKIKGKPIEPQKNYRVVTHNFLANGGDGYTLLKNLPQEVSDITVRDVFIEYIKKKKTIP